MRARRMRYIGVVAFGFALPVFGGVLDQVYTNLGTWEEQALTIPSVSEIDPVTFSSTGISSPLVSVSSSNGQILGNIWSDCVGFCGNLNGYFGKGTGATTTWTFSKPLYGFGANFAFSGVGGSLVLIQDGNNNQWIPLETTPDDGLHGYYYSGEGFFGVTSPIAFTQIVVWMDFENNGNTQSYTIPEMFLAPDPPISSPEPGALALVLMGLSGTGLTACIHRKRANRNSGYRHSAR
jgi:hypothetical protein